MVPPTPRPLPEFCQHPDGHFRGGRREPLPSPPPPPFPLCQRPGPLSDIFFFGRDEGSNHKPTISHIWIQVDLQVEFRRRCCIMRSPPMFLRGETISTRARMKFGSAEPWSHRHRTQFDSLERRVERAEALVHLGELSAGRHAQRARRWHQGMTRRAQPSQTRHVALRVCGLRCRMICCPQVPSAEQLVAIWHDSRALSPRSGFGTCVRRLEELRSRTKYCKRFAWAG